MHHNYLHSPVIILMKYLPFCVASYLLSILFMTAYMPTKGFICVSADNL